MGSRALRRFVTAHLREHRSWLRRSCSAPLSWRSRLVGEKGRVADADARDARGLILLMSAFGVPVESPALELYELYHAGGGLACAEVLKCSQLFVRNMHDVVADMLNKGIYHEAVGIILAFELQDVFPLAAILTYMIEKFVHNSNLAALKGHDEEELVLLRSISKYLEDHKLCSSEIYFVSIAKRIALLEECVGKPKQALKGTKRQRTAQEDSLECAERPKCPYASAASNASPNKSSRVEATSGAPKRA